VIKLFCAEDRKADFIEVFKKSAIDNDYDLIFPDISKLHSGKFDKFKDVYSHFSVNPSGFELSCFRRYFLALEWIGKSNDRFVICDSDLYISSNRCELPVEVVESVEKFCGSVGVLNGVAEKDISPHFSFWNRSLLLDFTSFLICMYEERSDELRKLYKEKGKLSKRPSISDMTLLYLWVKEHNIPFLNTNKVFNSVYIDHNISMSECLNEEFKSSFGRKKIVLNGGDWQLMNSNASVVRPILLHLQGKYKIASSALESGNKTELMYKSIFINAARIIRSRIGV